MSQAKVSLQIKEAVEFSGFQVQQERLPASPTLDKQPGFGEEKRPKGHKRRKLEPPEQPMVTPPQASVIK